MPIYQADDIIKFANLSEGTTGSFTVLFNNVTRIAPNKTPSDIPFTPTKLFVHPGIGSLYVLITGNKNKYYRFCI